MNTSRKIRVLVVDDSAVVRRMITDVLSKDSQIEVVGSAPDPYIARDMIQQHNPDVLTLDIEMPRMDGLTFLKILQQHHPIPVIVISSLSTAGSQAAMKALEAGAVDVLAKPNSAYSIGHLADQLAMRVKSAAIARRRVSSGSTSTIIRKTAASAPAIAVHPRQLLLIGASTGGTEAIRHVLTALPEVMPPIAIAQHIPAYFSKAFAERMDQLCQIEVREAVEGDELRPGLALIAPGDYHMTVHWGGHGYRVSLNQKPPIHHCRPAVDVLFRSASQCPGARILCSILTGMGSDGALGMQSLKAIGAKSIAQDESTCVVYGMPRAAVELGVVDQVLPLQQIAPAMIEWAQAHSLNRESASSSPASSDSVPRKAA